MNFGLNLECTLKNVSVEKIISSWFWCTFEARDESQVIVTGLCNPEFSGLSLLPFPPTCQEKLFCKSIKFRLCTLIFSLADFLLIINHRNGAILYSCQKKKVSLGLKTIRGSGVSDFKTHCIAQSSGVQVWGKSRENKLPFYLRDEECSHWHFLFFIQNWWESSCPLAFSELVGTKNTHYRNKWCSAHISDVL